VSPREDVDLARHRRFERVFAEVYGPLQRYVRRRADATVVDDVVADTMLVLWRRLDVVPADAELAWCYGAARRCLANHRRSDERRDRLAARVAGEPAAADGHAVESDRELMAALDELAADDRELVRLWAWEQLAPRELAVVSGSAPTRPRSGCTAPSNGSPSVSRRERTTAPPDTSRPETTPGEGRVADGRARRSTPPQRPAPVGLVAGTT
jgi:RNA polymerase sigma-70 factor, ECF subfamily